MSEKKYTQNDVNQELIESHLNAIKSLFVEKADVAAFIIYKGKVALYNATNKASVVFEAIDNCKEMIIDCESTPEEEPNR